MATVYAVAIGRHLQFDVFTGRLEIYETEKRAQENCPDGHTVVAVSIRKSVANNEGQKWNEQKTKGNESCGHQQLRELF